MTETVKFTVKLKFSAEINEAGELINLRGFCDPGYYLTRSGVTEVPILAQLGNVKTFDFSEKSSYQKNIQYELCLDVMGARTSTEDDLQGINI